MLILMMCGFSMILLQADFDDVRIQHDIAAS
jgi:hypothetical protein